METVEGMLTDIRAGGVSICEDITGSDNAYWAFARAFCLVFDQQPSGIVQPEHEVVLLLLSQILVDRPLRALPVPIVIHDQDTVRAHTRKQAVHLVTRRLIPIGV